MSFQLVAATVLVVSQAIISVLYLGGVYRIRREPISGTIGFKLIGLFLITPIIWLVTLIPFSFLVAWSSAGTNQEHLLSRVLTLSFYLLPFTSLALGFLLLLPGLDNGPYVWWSIVCSTGYAAYIFGGTTIPNTIASDFLWILILAGAGASGAVMVRLLHSVIFRRSLKQDGLRYLITIGWGISGAIGGALGEWLGILIGRRAAEDWLEGHKWIVNPQPFTSSFESTVLVSGAGVVVGLLVAGVVEWMVNNRSTNSDGGRTGLGSRFWREY